jgi:hypothetical protein
MTLKRDLAIAGGAGLLCGVGIYVGASALSTRLPTLLQGEIVVAITFVFLFAIALMEIPMMLFGLRQMARSPSTPRRLVLGTFTVYVAFAAVYASAFVLLTGQIVLGLVLAAVCFVRLVSGVWIKFGVNE